MQRTRILCELCGQEISKSNYTKHIRRHKDHPETFEDLTWKLTHDGLTCQYCGKECKNKNSLCNHERLCSKNPNRQEFIREGFNNQGRVAWNKGLTKEGISLIYHYRISKYELDFCDLDRKVDIEIDGDQHYLDKRIKQSDIERDNYLQSL